MSKRPILITPLVIGACLAIFVYQLYLGWLGAEVLEGWIRRHALVPANWRSTRDHPEVLITLFSSMFIHGGLVHLAGNLWFLWVFGSSLERRIGPVRFLTIYLLAGAAGGVLQLAVSWGSPVPVVGASGAISGVLGAYLMVAPWAWIVSLVPWVVPILPVPAFVFLTLWFVWQIYAGLAGQPSNVAWWAHVGGFVVGLILARRGSSATRGTRRVGRSR